MLDMNNQIVSLFELRKDQILSEAQKLKSEFDEYKELMMDGDELKPYERSYLYLYVRKNELSVEMSWRYHKYEMKYGRKNNTITLKRGKTSKYSQNALFKYAQYWERDIILDIENRASKLREEIDEINKILRRSKKINLPVFESHDEKEKAIKNKNIWGTRKNTNIQGVAL